MVVGGFVCVERQRLQLHVLLAGVERRRRAAERQGDETATSELPGEVAAGRLAQADMVLRQSVAPLLVEVLEPGLLEQLRPETHQAVPGLQDLAAPLRPVRRG